MPTTAKKASRKKRSRISGRTIHKQVHQKRSHRSNRRSHEHGQPRHSFTPVDLSEVRTTIPKFEVAAQLGGDSYFESVDSLLAHIDLFNETCEKIDRNWAERNWTTETTLYEFYGEMIKVIQEYHTKHNLECSFWPGMEKRDRYYTKPEYRDAQINFFETIDTVDVKMPGAWFLTELEKVDRKLFNILVAAIGKATHKFNIGDWHDAGSMAQDYVEQAIWEREHDPVILSMDEDEVKTRQDELKLWNEGDPRRIKKLMDKMSKFSVKKITNMVRRYPWNKGKGRFFKKRILVWLRRTLSLYERGADVNNYDQGAYYDTLGGDISYLRERREWAWSTNDNNWVEHNRWEFLNEHFNNCELIPPMRRVDISKPFVPDQVMIDFESWMSWSCYLFEDNFMKGYRGKKVSKLINILVDDNEEGVEWDF